MSQDLKSRWIAKTHALDGEDLESGLLVDLRRALKTAARGGIPVVFRWIDLVESRLLEVWASYESSELLEEEITAESVLGHQMLGEGVDRWLDVLADLREGLLSGQLQYRNLLREAVEAQRLLVTVQLMERESESLIDHFMEAWKN